MRSLRAAHTAYEPMTPVRMEKIRTKTRGAVAVAVPVVLSVAPCFWHLRQYALFLPHSQSGETALKSEDYDRAIRDLEFAVHYAPNSRNLRHSLGLAYIKSAEKQINAYQPDARRRERDRLAATTASVMGETKTVTGDKSTVAPPINKAKP